MSSNDLFILFVRNAKVLKDNYECLLMPFFRVKAIWCWKKMIYSLDMSDSKKDKLWRYLNSDIEYNDLVGGLGLDKFINK